MSGPSDRAVAKASHEAQINMTVTNDVLKAAHDPTLGLDRSVCLRDVARYLERNYGRLFAAEFEHEFGGDR